MSKLLVSDELWNLVEPILPKHPYVPGVGKPRVPDRVCLTGIIFVPRLAFRGKTSPTRWAAAA
jgi:hypothetical protein